MHGCAKPAAHAPWHAHLLVDDKAGADLAPAAPEDVGLAWIQIQTNPAQHALGHAQKLHRAVVAREGDVVGVAAVEAASLLGAFFQNLVGLQQNAVQQRGRGGCANRKPTFCGAQVQDRADGTRGELACEVATQRPEHQGPANARKAVADIGVDHDLAPHVDAGVVLDRATLHKAVGARMSAQRGEQAVQKGALRPLQGRGGGGDRASPAGVLGQLPLVVTVIHPPSRLGVVLNSHHGCSQVRQIAQAHVSAELQQDGVFSGCAAQTQGGLAQRLTRHCVGHMASQRLELLHVAPQSQHQYLQPSLVGAASRLLLVDFGVVVQEGRPRR